jgi:hypothetical protein
MTPEEMIGAICDPKRKYRYKLWRRWSADLPPLIWIMLNPSTADERQDDATIRRCTTFARQWGHGGIEVYNLFAYRATHPQQLRPPACVDPIGPENDNYLRAIPADRRIIVAWGAFPQYLGNRDRDVLLMLNELMVKCLGVTLGGYPKHPVRLSNDTKPESYFRPQRIISAAEKRRGE